MKKTYRLTESLLLEVDFDKYKCEILEATANFIKNVKLKDEEDETGKGAYWDCANLIVSREIGWLENLVGFESLPIDAFGIEMVVESIYYDLPSIAKELL